MDYMLKSSDERVVINDFVQGDPLSEENLDKTLELVSNLRKVDSSNPCKMGVSEVENPDKIRLSLPNKSIWLYSGYEFTDFFFTPIWKASEIDSNTKRKQIISRCTVMVDGKYINSQRNPSKKWAGSDNQRVIDTQQSLINGKVVLYCD